MVSENGDVSVYLRAYYDNVVLLLKKETKWICIVIYFLFQYLTKPAFKMRKIFKIVFP